MTSLTAADPWFMASTAMSESEALRSSCASTSTAVPSA